MYKSIAIFSGILEHDKNARRFKKMSMEEYLPLDMEYPTRQEAMEAIKLANLSATGHEIQVDNKASGKRRAVVYCSSIYKLPTSSPPRC